MRLSIVTPVWNDPRVSRCIQSIHAQNCAGEIEVIVVDGGSTEPTQKALRSVSSQIDHLISEPDRGIYDAMNKGIRLASGDAIGILNADDQYDDSDFLTQVQRAFQESAQVTYSDIVVERMDGSVKRRWRAAPASRHVRSQRHL
jgi:glycosyltransferase involved in cell wall biosynthesis